MNIALGLRLGLDDVTREGSRSRGGRLQRSTQRIAVAAGAVAPIHCSFTEGAKGKLLPFAHGSRPRGVPEPGLCGLRGVGLGLSLDLLASLGISQVCCQG